MKSELTKNDLSKNELDTILKDIKNSFLFFMEYTDDIVKGYTTTLKRNINTITKFEIKEYNDNEITVTIETHSPGSLIGKKGCVIEALKIFINNDTNTDMIINIDLQECKMFHNIYSVDA